MHTVREVAVFYKDVRGKRWTAGKILGKAVALVNPNLQYIRHAACDTGPVLTRPGMRSSRARGESLKDAALRLDIPEDLLQMIYDAWKEE